MISFAVGASKVASPFYCRFRLGPEFAHVAFFVTDVSRLDPGAQKRRQFRSVSPQIHALSRLRSGMLC